MEPIEPQQIYYQRPLDPQHPVITDEVRQRHEQSKRKYPKLNLSEGEYVISAVKRHAFGLIQIWGAVIFVVAVVLTGLTLLMSSQGELDSTATLNLPAPALAIAALLICALALIGGYIASYVYSENRFYLTNESVIQCIQTSLFAKREQTISLLNVEDASFTKTGILQYMLDYGTIRLSTQGDETTYRFTFAPDPERNIAVLNDAVESFKNGRPVAHH